MANSEGIEIHVTLRTRELSGIRIATIPFVDVQAILIPRDRLGEVKKDIDGRLGVYLLLDPDEHTFYIGRSDDVWNRLSYWNSKVGEEWWGTAVAVISQAELGLSEKDIRWLEWRCIKAAREIVLQVAKTAKEIGPEVTKGRFQFQKNQKQPTKPSIANAMQGAMSVLFDSLCTLVSVLGYPVFEPLEDIDRPSVQDEISVPNSDAVFRCRGKQANATGVWVQNHFMVRKGSLARPDVVPCAKETVGPLRKKMIDDGVLTEEGGKLRFAQDHTFRSVSGAASVVLGRPADGWIEWKKNGRTMDEIMRPG
jgi:hypothetical protein